MEENRDKSSAVKPLEYTHNTGAHIRVYRKNDALLPATVVGGLVGTLVGTLPVTVWYLIFRFSFAPMYVFLPLSIYLGLKLFRGFRGKRGLIALCVFTVIGFYLTLLSVEAAAYALRLHMLVFNVPLVTVTLIGQHGVLTGPVFSSAYIFPFVFSLLGVFLSEEFLMRKTAHVPAPEPSLEEAAEQQPL